MKNKMDELKKITRKEWFKEGEKRFGKDKKNWKFKCPNCGNIQDYHDFDKLTTINKEEIENVVYFSCIGRWIEDSKGTITNKSSPCDYTNGGLFNFAKLEVDFKGKKISVFEFAEEGDGRKNG